MLGTSSNYQRWWHGFGSTIFTLFTYKTISSMTTVNGTPYASYKDRFRFFNINIIQCFWETYILSICKQIDYTIEDGTASLSCR